MESFTKHDLDTAELTLAFMAKGGIGEIGFFQAQALQAELARLRAENDAMRPVVEAAVVMQQAKAKREELHEKPEKFTASELMFVIDKHINSVNSVLNAVCAYRQQAGQL